MDARAQAWVEGTREAEQSLQDSHSSSNGKAKI
jgi:hypothetical protein